MKVFNKVAAVAVAVGMMGVASHAMAAGPGFVALEGSDATALHMDPSYTPDLFHYLQGSSSLPVLVYNPTGAIDLSSISGGVATVNTSSLSGENLSNYSALYIESAYGCCTADNTALNGYGASVLAFIAAGGNLSIENYVGGDYDGVVVGGSQPAGVIEGYTAENGGVGYGPTCTDGESVTAQGIAKGFSQPPVDGCWSHQAYSNSYWGALGYIDLIHSSPDYVFGDGTNNGSSLLALGGTLGTPTPEPTTWAMMMAGLFGMGLVLRRRQGVTATA